MTLVIYCADDAAVFECEGEWKLNATVYYNIQLPQTLGQSFES